MFLIPKNRKYKSEPIVKTLIAPIVILTLCLLAILSFNPFTEPGTSRLFGLEQNVSLTVQRTEINKNAPIGKSTRCSHWLAYGTHQGRELRVRDCLSRSSVPAIGETLNIVAAPTGNDTILASDADHLSWLHYTMFYATTVVVLYGVIVSLRLLYIGYSSNWFNKK